MKVSLQTPSGKSKKSPRVNLKLMVHEAWDLLDELDEVEPEDLGAVELKIMHYLYNSLNHRDQPDNPFRRKKV